MVPRPFIPIGLTSLAVLLFMGSMACSSSQRRDQNYGSDAGASYRPEAAVFTENSQDALDPDALDQDEARDATLSLDRPQANDDQATPQVIDALEATDAPSSTEVPEATDVPEAADVEPDADIV